MKEFLKSVAIDLAGLILLFSVGVASLSVPIAVLHWFGIQMIPFGLASVIAWLLLLSATTSASIKHLKTIDRTDCRYHGINDRGAAGNG